MAVGLFSFSESRCSIAVCLATHYSPFFFFSKFPEKVAPIWNLIHLFPPLVWLIVFISITMVTLMFYFSSYIYCKMGIEKNIIQEEITLVPIRCEVTDAYLNH